MSRGRLSPRSIGLTLQLVRSVEEEIAIYRRWFGEHRVDGVFVVDVRHDDPRVEALARDGPAGSRDRRAARGRAHPGRLARRGLGRGRGRALPRRARPPPDRAGRRRRRVRAHPGADARVPRRRRASSGSRQRWCRPTTRPRAAPARPGGCSRAPEPPTAIIFDSDLLAVTGLGVAQQMGFTVPDDLSLIGWDDSLISRVVHPPLTAITRDIEAYGATAARHLLAVIDGATREDVEVARGELTPRGSTAPPRSAAPDALPRATASGGRGGGGSSARCWNPDAAMCENHNAAMCENRLTLNRISDGLRVSPHDGDEGAVSEGGHPRPDRASLTKSPATTTSSATERGAEDHGKPQEMGLGPRRHRRRHGARISDDGRSRSAAAVCVRSAAQRDALHVGHCVGAVQPVQPAAEQRERDRHGRAPVRDAVPVRPAQGQVHPVARDRRQVGRPDLRPARCGRA